MRALFLMLFLIGGALAASPLRAVEIDPIDDDPAPSGLAERFEVLAFFEENGAPVPLRRWERPIAVRLVVADQARFRPFADLVRSTVAELGQVTGLPTSFDDGRITVMYADPGRMSSMMADLPAHRRAPVPWDCRLKVFTRSDAALVLIRDDLPAAITRNCIVQEIAQTLGLTNDIDDPANTVFSSRSVRDTLSDTDRKLFRILYDPRLKPGMRRAEAMPIVRRIIAENGW